MLAPGRDPVQVLQSHSAFTGWEWPEDAENINGREQTLTPGAAGDTWWETQICVSSKLAEGTLCPAIHHRQNRAMRARMGKKGNFP